MRSFQLILNSFFGTILSPFQSLSPLWALTFISILTGLFMLLVFRYTSDQQRIKTTKNAIKAHILELWLFRDNLKIMLLAQLRILKLNGTYLKLAIKPMIILIVPLVLLLISLEGWFGSRALRLGEVAIVSVLVSDVGERLLENISLQVNNGAKVETPPLRIQQAKEADWRIRASAAGEHILQVKLPGHRVEKKLMVSNRFIPVAPRRVAAGFWNTVLNPIEQPIPNGSPVKQIEVHYPKRAFMIFGWNIHWLVFFFITSILSGFVLKGFFRVEL